MKVLRFTCAALLLSAPVFAQDEMARRQAVEVAARVPFEKAMKGAPYSAEVIVESSQTLADGNRINRKTTGRVYRDSEGRTRREDEVAVRSLTTAGNSVGFVPGVRTTISIVDPVAGFSYSLDPERKIAWRTTVGGANAIMGKVEAAEERATEERKVMVEKLAAERKARAEGALDEQSAKAAPPTPAAGAGGGARGGGGGGARGGGEGVIMARGGGAGGRGRGYAMAPDTPLEHKTIEGVAVEGRKTTTVIPAGQVGNEQPITVTSEEWRSPELGLLVLTKHTDPRSGESIYRLQNISRAEPDQSLFMVPADYTIRETGIRRMLEESVRKH
jgi:hypothetical protein